MPLEKNYSYNKLFDVVINHIIKDGKFNVENTLNEYFNKWKKNIKIDNKENVEKNKRIEINVIRKRPNVKSEKKLVPRIRYNEKIRFNYSRTWN